MAKSIKIEPRTERFIQLYNSLNDRGLMPSNIKLAGILGINSPQSITEITKRRLNIQPEPWKRFLDYFNITEGDTDSSVPPIQNSASFIKEIVEGVTKSIVDTLDKASERVIMANEKVLEEKELRRKDSEKTVALLSRLLEDKIDKINANLSVTHNDVTALMIQQRSEHASMMDALDRIEGNPVGTIAKEASTVELAASETLKDTGKKKAAHK